MSSWIAAETVPAELPTLAEAMALARAWGVDRVDAQMLLTDLIGRSRTWLLTHDQDRLDPDQARRWIDRLERRADGVPVAYLTGRHEFHGLDLDVTPAVLDPRPDTETLVDWALELLAQGGPAPQVLDLGTGSGAIALALRCRGPAAAEVTAVDVSAEALVVARRNGQRLGLAVRWLLGSWFEPVRQVGADRFELIISNPPYIAEGDPHLPALRHEPRLALTSGTDGLDAIRHLVGQAPDHLRSGGWLLFEHGFDQGPAVAALLQARGFTRITHRHDLAGHCRCTGGCFAV
jgi:release factor glutamine methyltransferase